MKVGFKTRCKASGLSSRSVFLVGGWVVGSKVIIVSVHILYVRFLGFKDFQDWTGPDTGLTISEKIKILKLFELDNFGLKDQFGLVFVYLNKY